MDFLKNIIWGWCIWDTLIVVFVIVVTALFLIRRYKLNKEIKELKDQM